MTGPGGGEHPADEGWDDDSDPDYKPLYSIRNLLKWIVSWVESYDIGAEPSVKEPILKEIYEWLNVIEVMGRELNTEPEGSDSGSFATTSSDVVFYSPSLLDLPPELLLEVVQLAMHCDSHIVVAISHINRSFRNFALSTSMLWTSIDIMFPQTRVLAYLKRSGASPLRIQASLVMLTLRSAAGSLRLGWFEEIIRPHADRILSLEMRYTNSGWSESALTLLSRSWEMPRLEEFNYALLRHKSHRELLVSAFRCTPKTIRLEGVGIKHFLSIYSAQVTCLKVTECWESGLTDWRDALRLMPSLETLEIADFKAQRSISDENYGNLTSIPPFTLPHLRTLTLIRIPTATVLLGLLQALEAPSLTSATIAFLEPNGVDGYFSLEAWLKPEPTHGMSDLPLLPFVSKNPQLQELNLHNCLMTPDMWAAAFRKLPHLSKLRIALSDVSNEALESLAPSSPPNNTPMLPSLTHLTLDNEALDEDSDLSFAFIEHLLVERARFYQCQQANLVNAEIPRVQALKSVVLRGWNESRISRFHRDSDFASLRDYVDHLHVEMLRTASHDEDGAPDEEWESQSEVSWTSGDQDVVDLGNRLFRQEWGMDPIRGPA
ncbi:hypothetical protein FRB90_003085 [Tulasnella sp. 427]|nr:hypothetical protein FRB90_003085 [Tulasnella sp. 427]